MRALLLSLLIALCPLTALAQDSGTAAEDKGFLTTFLEDNLSGAGREVRIDGFAGALSSRATFTQLTIADSDGIWLTIRNGAISWNRSALLSGRVEIAEMSAEAILVDRGPSTGPAAGGAETETGEFSLPELPVSLRIGLLRADRVALGADILGEPLEFRAEGAAELSGGQGEARFEAERTDGGATGNFTLRASYSNATKQAAIDLLAAEGKGGLVARMVGLPGDPSILLALNGAGPITDFAADVALSTDGAPRLTGKVGFGATGADLAAGQRVRLDLAGDVRPLFAASYHGFFGESSRLAAEGRRHADGRIELSAFDLQSSALHASGEAAIGAGGEPRRLRAEISLSGSDAAPVVLPMPGAETTVTGADLRMTFDAAQDEGWSLDGTLTGFRRAELLLGDVRLDGSGRIAPGRAGGTVTLSVRGLQAGGPDLASAVGERIDGRVVFSWQKGGALRLPVLVLSGEDYGLTGRAAILGDTLDANAAIRASDLSRLAPLIGAGLSGAADVAFSGKVDLAGGGFDLSLGGSAADLGVGIAEVNRLLAGTTTLRAEAAGHTGDIALKSAEFRADGFAATLAGRIAPGASDLSLEMTLDDLGRLRQGLGGAVGGQMRLTEEAGTRRVEGAIRATDPQLGNATLTRLLPGRSDLDFALSAQDGVVRLERLDLSGAKLSARVGATDADPQTLTVEARLSDTAILSPELPGVTQVSGTIRNGAAYRLDLVATGPGGIDAKLTGDLAADLSRADLAATGRLRAEVANGFIAPRAVTGTLAFDLRLNGPLALSSVSGTVTAEGLRAADPTLFMAAEGVTARASLSGADAQISLSGGFRDGGNIGVQGSISLAPGLDSDLSVTLDRARLRDPQLFETEASGALRLTGPIARGGSIAGTIQLGQTDIRVGTASLGSTRIIPDIVHRSEPDRVRASRARAGLIQSEAAPRGSRRPIAIDLRIAAPQQIYVRGRGLDAELGGSLVLGGTTDNIVPSGQFRLVRGRLDILTKRLNITEGMVEMRGALVPHVRFVATHQGDQVTTTVTIEGPATAPEIRFSSSPELPEEEVLSQLLFGRGVETLSVFQAAQLASAVATLAGRGGEGIVGRLRTALGVDDLDVSTDETGGTTLRAGKYVSEKVYTDITLDGEGKTEINLNLDIRDGLKARGTVDSEGSTGLGIFFEKDY
ncbi:translocation/assembly module TamB domain-containing protein [Albidovulum sediminis]|uniref:Translocation/assembly module TamB domain-containing protein n=1 Tax=Albidovulum sediminis TaxID=3066345 RepID=A0ABT2NQW0_9RHOB|nr:translocation/assembly module TamB domain-containing protein [Defluviimonas sediminis]MCT8331284.1 translocation/assembly module TamB domain-containing protein [Defluviimonas sediminis]